MRFDRATEISITDLHQSESSPLLSELLAGMKDGRIVIPEFQRRFVWDQNQIERLFDSVYLGLPIGTLLLWRPEGGDEWGGTLYEFFDQVDGFEAREKGMQNAEASIGTAQYAVLDGQQRLTSLAIGLGAFNASDFSGRFSARLPRRWVNLPESYPDKYLHVDLRCGTPDEDRSQDAVRFQFRELIGGDDHRMQGHEHLWIPVKDIWREGEAVAFDLDSSATDALLMLRSRLESLRLGSHIVTEGRDIALESFARLNAGGSPLTHVDLLIMSASAGWGIESPRTEFDGLLSEVNAAGPRPESEGHGSEPIGLSFSLADLVQTAIYVEASMPTKKAPHSVSLNPDTSVHADWEEFKKAFVASARLLRGLGLRGDTIGAPRMIRPLTLLAYRSERAKLSPAEYFDEPVKQWIRRASLQPRAWNNTVLRQLFNLMNADDELKSFRDVLSDLHLVEVPIVSGFRDVEADLLDVLMGAQYGEGRTWRILTYCFPEALPSDAIDVDHFCTRQKENDLPPEVRAAVNLNAIENLCLLSSSENRSKGADWPIVSAGAPPGRDEVHGFGRVPDDVDAFKTELPRILTRRRELIRSRLATLLGI